MSQVMAPQQHPADWALPCENTFLPPNLRSARVLLYANSGLMVQHSAGDSSSEYQWLGRAQDHTHSTPDLHLGMAKTSLLPKTL